MVLGTFFVQTDLSAEVTLPQSDINSDYRKSRPSADHKTSMENNPSRSTIQTESFAMSSR
jgi:hypothetical protein